jgi:hypothetical protein
MYVSDLTDSGVQRKIVLATTSRALGAYIGKKEPVGMRVTDMEICLVEGPVVR